MGSPLGPSFANMFICALEQKFLSNCLSNHRPVLRRRLVDDTFCILQGIAHVECFLNNLNHQHPNIKFIHELEEDNSLPFLHILVTHVENGFSTNLHSIHLKKRLTEFLAKIYLHVDFWIVFRANKPIGSLFSFTDRVPRHICSTATYKFTCSSCQAT